MIPVLMLAAPFSYGAAVQTASGNLSILIKARWMFGAIGLTVRRDENADAVDFYIFGFKLKEKNRKAKPKKEEPEKKETEIKKTKAEKNNVTKKSTVQTKKIKKSKKAKTEKKFSIFEFLRDNDIKLLYGQTVLLIKRLLKKLKPKYFYAGGEIGFESPAVTGVFFGALGAVQGMKKINVKLTGNFNEEACELDVKLKGSFSLGGLLVPFARFALSKPVWKLIKEYIKK